MSNVLSWKMQGDVIFEPFNGKKEGKCIKHKGSFVLALGETTGHKHVITCEPDKMDITELLDGSYLLTLSDVATVTHEEHLPIVLQPGIYHVGAEREVDWFSKTVRQVID